MSGEFARRYAPKRQVDSGAADVVYLAADSVRLSRLVRAIRAAACALALAGAGSACHDEPDDETTCPCAPKVDRVEIVPSIVFVPRNEIFEARARLIAEDGGVIPESFGHRPAWQSEDSERLQVIDRVGHSVWLRARGFATDPKEVPVKITVEANGKSRSAPVTITDPLLFSEDRIDRDPYPLGTPVVSVAPVVSFVEASVTLPRSTAAFVRSVEIGSFSDGEVTLFSADKEMGVNTSTLLESGPRTVRFIGLGDPLPIRVTIWVPNFVVNEGWSAITTKGIVELDVADALRTLSRNPIGLSLDWEITPYDEVDPMDGVCPGRRPGGPNPGRLNVYYAPDLEYHKTAMRCDEGEILVSLANAVATTLIHEIGHALSLNHTNGREGFENKSHNVMMTTPFTRADVRTHFSIGQAFRMNRHIESVVFRTTTRSPDPPLLKACFPESSGAGCPALSHDVPDRTDP